VAATDTYGAGGDGHLLAENRKLVRLSVHAMREMYSIWDAVKVPSSPRYFRLWQRLLISVIVKTFGTFIGSSAGEVGTDQINRMRDEVEVITAELLELASIARVSTPALKKLVRLREAAS
jgi:hypothetical protein